MQLTKSREIILSYLQKNGDTPRVLLSKETGLTKPSITQITGELIKEGLLTEKGEQPFLASATPEEDSPKKRGRRKVLVGINENYRLVLGMVAVKEGIFAGLSNLNGEILQKTFLPLLSEQPTRQELLELFVTAYEYLLRENCITKEQLLGLGICISEECGEILGGEVSSEQLARLKTELSHAVGLPIAIFSLADGLLLGQRLFFKGRAAFFNSGIMLLANSPVGVSLFANGKIHRGFSGQAGGLTLIKPLLCDFFEISESDEPSESEHIRNLYELFCFFDPEYVFVYGVHTPEAGNALEQINSFISKRFYRGKKPKQYEILPCGIKKDTLFLAGSAVAISMWFNFL